MGLWKILGSRKGVITGLTLASIVGIANYGNANEQIGKLAAPHLEKKTNDIFGNWEHDGEDYNIRIELTENYYKEFTKRKIDNSPFHYESCNVTRIEKRYNDKGLVRQYVIYFDQGKDRCFTKGRRATITGNRLTTFRLNRKIYKKVSPNPKKEFIPKIKITQ